MDPDEVRWDVSRWDHDSESLLGPSGRGKTTTLRMIAGSGAPSEGVIELDGDDLTRTPSNRRPMSMVRHRPNAARIHLEGFGMAPTAFMPV